MKTKLMLKLYALSSYVLAAATALCVLVMLLPFTALADGNPTVPGTDTSVAPADPFANIGAFVQMCLYLVQHKSAAGIAAILVIAVVGALKKFAPDSSKLGVWLHSQVGGWTTNLALTTATPFLFAALAGTHFDFQTVLTLLGSGLGVGFTAAGARELLKDIGILKPSATDAAQAGQQAAQDPSKTLKS